VATSRQITIGAELPHLYIVTEGLNKNDKILLEGLRKVKNGQKISYTYKDPHEAISEMHELFAE
jgi:membrane fusion protein (multidrug efflux system)